MKYLIILLIIFSSCNLEQRTKSDKDNKKSEIVLTEYQKDSVFKMQNLADIHLALNEPDLNHLEYECYRLTLYKSFENSMVFRVDRKGDDYHKLVVKEFNTKNSDGPSSRATLINEMTFDLTISEFNEFKDLLNQSYYWTLKFWDERSGFDGNSYVLEAFVPFSNVTSEKKYHNVARWEPYEGSFKQACEKLIEYYNDELQSK